LPRGVQPRYSSNTLAVRCRADTSPGRRALRSARAGRRRRRRTRPDSPIAPGCLPVFTSDGLHLYFYALTAHFGQWIAGVGRRARQWQVAAQLIYGQVKKVYRRRQLVRVMCVMRCGTRDALRAAFMGFGLSGRLNTAFVERLNLTVRQSVAALVRRTWSTAQDAPQLRCDAAHGPPHPTPARRR
jgi:hypothetical protein